MKTNRILCALCVTILSAGLLAGCSRPAPPEEPAPAPPAVAVETPAPAAEEPSEEIAFEQPREVVARLQEQAKTEPRIMVVNETGTDLMEVRWIDAAGKDWGDQSLAADYLPTNGAAFVLLPPGVTAGTYTIRAIDPDGKDLLWPAQAVTNGQTVILRRL